MVYVYTSYNKTHRNYNLLFSIKLDRDDNSNYDINICCHYCKRERKLDYKYNAFALALNPRGNLQKV